MATEREGKITILIGRNKELITKMTGRTGSRKCDEKDQPCRDGENTCKRQEQRPYLSKTRIPTPVPSFYWVHPLRSQERSHRISQHENTSVNDLVNILKRTDNFPVNYFKGNNNQSPPEGVKKLKSPCGGARS